MKERKLRFLNIMAGKKRRHSSAGANATPKVTTTTTAEELKADNAIINSNGDGDGNANEEVEAEGAGKIDRFYKSVEHFKKRVYSDDRIDPTKSFEDMAGITDADLPIIPNFDVHDVYNRLEIDEDEEENEKANSIFYSQLVTKLGEEGHQKWNFSNYRLSQKDILFEFKHENFLPLVSQGDVLIAGKPRVVTQTPCPVRRAEATPEEPRPKRLKQTLKQAPPKPGPSSAPAPAAEKLFVLAKELATNKRTILLLRKGENIPKGYVVASIEGDMPQLPDKLADFPPDQLKEAILEIASSGIANNSNSASVSPSSTGIHRTRMRTRSGPAGPINNLIARTPDPSHRLSTSLNKSVTTSKSIVMPPPPMRISVAEGAASASTPQKKAEGIGGRLVYKQRSSNADKVINLINKTATIGRIGDCTVVDAQSNHFNSASSPAPPTRRSTTPIITSTSSLSKVNRAGSQSQLPPVMLSQCTITPVDPLADDLNSEIDTSSYGTGSDSTKKVKIKPTYYACKICGETYPGDNVYRRHMVLRHDTDVADEEIEEARVSPTILKSCIRCRILIFGNNVENLEVHRRRCWPAYTLEQMFKEMNVTNVRTPQHACGMCKMVCGARHQLKFHIRDYHKNLYRKCIVDPEFRCSRCLKRFDESKTMMRHCAQCVERYPRPDTIVEVARTFIFCEYCKRKHGTLAETTGCYLARQVFRCVLCLSLHKQKSSFYQHLHTYHGLTVDKEPKLTMRCLFCDSMPQERYTSLFPHIVTNHYTPMIQRNPTSPMPPPPLIRIGAGAPVPPKIRSQTMKPIAQKYPPGHISVAPAMANAAATAMTMPVRNPNPGTFAINPQQQKVNLGMATTVTPAVTYPRTATASSLVRHPPVQPAASTPMTVKGGGPYQQMYAVPIGGGKMMLLPMSSGLIRPSTTITPVSNPNPSLPNGTTVAVVRPVASAPGTRNTTPTLVRVPVSSVATPARTPLILQGKSPASNINSNTEKTPIILSTMSMSRNAKSPGPIPTPTPTMASQIQSTTSRNNVTFHPVGGNASGVQVVTVDGRPLPVELFRRNSTGGGQTPNQSNKQQTVPIIISSVSGAPRLINAATQQQLVRPIPGAPTSSTVRAAPAPTAPLIVVSSPTPIITPTAPAATSSVIPPQSVAVIRPATSKPEVCKNVSEIAVIDLADTESTEAGAKLNENQIVPPPPTSVRISILPKGTTSTPIIPK